MSARALVVAIVLAACQREPETAKPRDAFADVDCKSVRPPVEPDLVAWEPEKRTQLDKLRRQGVVAVRYEAKGCDVDLELIPQCIGPRNKYVYSAFKANETKSARSAQEVVTTWPVGAANLLDQAKAGVRADLGIVGRVGLPEGATISDVDLVGPECKRATHVLGAIYVGGFSLGERREGDARICQRAASEGLELGGCSVPLRVSLLGIEGRAAGPIELPVRAPRAVEPAPEGTFDQASIERVVRDHQSALRIACWSSPGSLRRITASAAVAIDPRGIVSGVETRVVEADGPPDVATAVARCIGAELKTWRFPEPGKEQRVTLPFHLMKQ